LFQYIPNWKIYSYY